MKKNNSFLIAYILFILICLVVKNYWDYPLWSTIVAAVTTASWLFSISDMFFSSQKMKQTTIDIYADYPEGSISEISRIKRALEIRRQQIKNAENSDLFYTEQDKLEDCESTLEHLCKMESRFQKIKEKMDKQQKAVTREYFLAHIFVT